MVRCPVCGAEYGPVATLWGDLIDVRYPSNCDQHYYSVSLRSPFTWIRLNMQGEIIQRGPADDLPSPEHEQELLAAGLRYLQQIQAAAARHPWISHVAAHEGALYVRFGLPPRGGRSRNYLTGQEELGVSAYPARLNRAAACIQLEDAAILPGTLITYVITGRRAYLVTGEECGTGSDGEPVLRKVRVICPLRWHPDAEGFRPAAAAAVAARRPAK